MNKEVIRKYEVIYNIILHLYPRSYRQEFGEEMKYVFSESLKDTYRENGKQGISMFWVRTFLDSILTLFTQHYENQKGGDIMKSKSKKAEITIIIAAIVILLAIWAINGYEDTWLYVSAIFITIPASWFLLGKKKGK